MTRKQDKNTYLGWPNYNTWAVHLYLSNDQKIYRFVNALLTYQSKDQVARALLRKLPPRTPEGVRLTVTNIRAALVNWEKE